MTKFGKLLTKMRESHGLNVPELANLSGYDKKSHYEYEDGSVAPPDAYKLQDICEAMGATHDECVQLIEAAFDDHKERIGVKKGYSLWKVGQDG
ncbi:MAG TPA: helix-turn-helix domain-containing protein [Oligoflexus sp.]|uniref:helix-turn-helix domain-containing protein n=1 Tax=Oligoflexus sp. TaxID=1971216 RepID=UPI002D5DEF78|nr:helix-turn-helix domain-containing protein [Oligoflexus sp.]HYX32602.1 helix-turn-helix domain-containing protein [Oligoflexus sp.]